VLAGKRRATQDEIGLMGPAADAVSRLPLLIDDRPGLTAEQIVIAASSAKRELGGLDLVVVDHFHKMRFPKSAGQRSDDAMNASVTVLCDAAKRLGVALVLLAQLNRKCEERSDKRPMLSDLREAGGLEQDAYGVWSPFRPGAYDDNADQREAELIGLKHRNGECRTIPMRWYGPRMTYTEATP